MHRSWLLCALLGSLAWGQTPTVAASSMSTARTNVQATSQAARPAATEHDDNQPLPHSVPEIPMDAIVLTIKGFCPGQESAPGSACETVITRAQFESLASAIQPTMNPVMKRQLASLYPRLLVMSHGAETQGLDKEPHYQQMMAYARMQILMQALTRKLQGESAQVSDAEITDYYQEHLEMFQVYTLQRLLVPLYKQSPEGDRDMKGARKEQPAETREEQAARRTAQAVEMTKLAETLRARAAAGEDFVSLQKEAFTAAGVKVESPNTSMGKVRRSSIPTAHLAVLQLKEGEASQLISDAGGHYIYKLELREQLTLDQVRDEVRGTLISDRLKDAMDKIQNSYTTETNEAYFQNTPHKDADRKVANPAQSKP